MKSISLAIFLALIVTSATASDAPFGFPPEDGSAQAELEQRFDAELKTDHLRTWMERMSAHPHPVGSPGSRSNAEFMVEQFRSWGYDAELAEYQVLFPTPRIRQLELLEPEHVVLDLTEPPIGGDSPQTDKQLPPYNAFSIDGDVTAELVYVNYGIPDDYKELARRGISVKGKIVIARYGASWRGIKPKVAAEHGAIGCILYSDPRDDGFFVGDTYPEGGFRPAQGAQRGSVADMPLYPGDPQTPFVASTPSAERLPKDEIRTLTRIPVMPISWQDAQPLLAALEGPVAPEAWRGALPHTYHLGPGPAKVRLQLAFNWDQVTAYNVIARMTGSQYPDQWILRGNHHDAWVNGATDPVSGMVALMEEARAIAELTRDGWRPKRTLIYAAWDAEEPGLIGSTEWVEHHRDELMEKAVAYINTDSTSRGFLYMGGSHTLEKMLNEVAASVPDPQLELNLQDRARAVIATTMPAFQKQALHGGDLPLAPLGSGSDYTPFLQHLGVASLNLAFFGEGDYGQYHSAYDTFDHYVRFMDPDFRYGVTLAQVTGRVVLRLSESKVLPFDHAGLVNHLQTYVKEVEKLADDLRESTRTENLMIQRGYYRAAADPRTTHRDPVAEAPVPHPNFAPLQNAIESLKRSLKRLESAQASGAPDGDKLNDLNRILYQSERTLTRPEGLPERPWFVHHVYAPGFYTGYGVKTLPAVREAIEARRWNDVDEQIRITAEVLQALDDSIQQAARIYESTAEESAP